MAALTPLSFAIVPADSTIYNLPIDNSYPYVTSYFYGSNSGIIDCRLTNGQWRRFVIDNQSVTVNLTVASGVAYLDFYNKDTQAFHNYIYTYTIGSSYSSGTSFTSNQYSAIINISDPYQFQIANPIYINSCGVPFEAPNAVNLSHCDFNSYYPFTKVSGTSDSRIDQVINNQASESSAAESRYSAQQSADNSRQSEIMNAGSDVTVSTIDNWVGGNNGLAGKLTELAATLSSNADIFSQNQSQNQANLSKAGEFVGNVFNQIPTGITAAAVCFLIILIAVKVVGR